MFPAHRRRGFGYEIMQAMSTYVVMHSPVLLHEQNLKTTLEEAFYLSHENPARAKERLRLNV